MSTIGGRIVEEVPPSMGASMVEADSADGLLGVMHAPAVPSPEERERAEAERHREIELAHVRFLRETLEHVKTQPLVDVAAADVARVALNADMTLADAAQILEDCGGSVRPGDHGTLRFALPASLHPDADATVRARALDAVVVLDASRPLVHAALTSRKRELPDARPAAGGGVVA